MQYRWTKIWIFSFFEIIVARPFGKKWNPNIIIDIIFEISALAPSFKFSMTYNFSVLILHQNSMAHN